MTLASQIASVVSAVTGLVLVTLALRAWLREPRDDERKGRSRGKHRRH